MAKLLSSITFFALLHVSAARADECRFNYWEVIPAASSCKVFFLPDFEFRPIPKGAALKGFEQFCNQFGVSSKFGKQVVGYCYTGEGDRMGPSFRLGDEGWNNSKQEKDRIYFADLNFSGCSHGRKAQGIVFGRAGWKRAPSEIERSWVVRGKLAKCLANP